MSTGPSHASHRFFLVSLKIIAKDANRAVAVTLVALNFGPQRMAKVQLRWELFDMLPKLGKPRRTQPLMQLLRVPFVQSPAKFMWIKHWQFRLDPLTSNGLDKGGDPLQLQEMFETKALASESVYISLAIFPGCTVV